jgi:hypothetical protein
VTNAKNPTGAVLDETVAADQGSCFQIFPYKGTGPSADVGTPSNVVCVPFEPVTLTPTKIQVAHDYYDHSENPCASPDSNPVGYAIGYTNFQPNGPNIAVGFLNRDYFGILAVGGIPCNIYSDLYQSVLTFDVSKLPNHAIASAKLTLNVALGAKNDNPPSGPNDGNEAHGAISCATSAGLATNFIFGKNGLVSVSSNKALTFDVGMNEPTLSLDLTSMVNAWRAPNAVNNGVVLSSSGTLVTPEKYDLSNKDCMTQYTDPKLTVTFKN